MENYKNILLLKNKRFELVSLWDSTPELGLTKTICAKICASDVCHETF